MLSATGAAMLSAQDKNVVDRGDLRRNGASRQAYRAARDRLHHGGGIAPRFLGDLMRRHGETQKSSLRLVLPIILTVLACEALLWWSVLREGPNALTSLVLLTGTAALFLVAYTISHCHAFASQRHSDRSSFDQSRRFANAMQTACGSCWALLVVAAPGLVTTQGAEFGTVTALAFACIGMVLHVHLSMNLREGFVFASFPIAVALIVRAGVTMAPMEIAAAVCGVVLLLILLNVSHRLHESVLASLEASRTQDEAVLEASETRALSEEARRRAEDANLAKTRFLATMSHELRTPLNAILGFSEIMSTSMLGPLNEPYLGYARDIHSSGTHLLKLINDILDLSRVEAGKYDLNEEALFLRAVSDEARQMIAVKAEQKSITLQFEAEIGLPPVWVDERAMRQVVLNLLSNAVKFTQRGGIVALTVGWTKGGGQYISVRDNGPGIAEEELPHVLDSFGQGSIALRAAEPGTGLGLPIVKAFAEMHEGRLDLRSRLREGTEAIVFLPRRRVMADEVRTAEQRPRRFKATG